MKLRRLVPVSLVLLMGTSCVSVPGSEAPTPRPPVATAAARPGGDGVFPEYPVQPPPAQEHLAPMTDDSPDRKKKRKKKVTR